jgi:hypothetical protein
MRSNKKIKVYRAVMCACLGLLTLSPGMASEISVAGTGHDLAAHPAISGPSDPCQFCHAGSEPYDGTWSRTEVQKTFKLFSSKTLRLKVEQPGRDSRFCLGCHDGETAFDALHGGAGTPGNNMQTIFPGSESVIGLDMSDFHPVGFDLAGNINGIRSMSFIEASGLPLARWSVLPATMSTGKADMSRC